MPNTLVIVESPAKAHTIGKILGRNYKVVASMGHVMDLPQSTIGVDLSSFEPTYTILDKKKKVLSSIISMAKLCDNVLLCSDGDREGEMIAKNIGDYIISKVKKVKIQRATFNEITPRAIKNAVSNPREIDSKLVNSQQARRILDRIVGYKMSPLLWNKIKRGLSAGRVQSVAVRILSEREKEISKFKSKEYWTIKGSFNKDDLVWEATLKSIEIDGIQKKLVLSAEDMEKFELNSKSIILIKDEEYANKIKSSCNNRPYHISSIEIKEVEQKPWPPFNTSGLQQAAANRLGFDAKRTMRIAQDLYEGVDVGGGPVGLITYMRTDSFNISQEASLEAKSYILEKLGDKYYPGKQSFYKSKSGSQGAHECIRPTQINLIPSQVSSSLSKDQYNLYDIIWKRFIASQMSPCVYNSMSYEMQSKDSKPIVTFRSTGKKVIFDGWTKLYSSDDSQESTLPVLEKGQEVTLKNTSSIQHFTQPPPRYNDASLVKTLEKEGIGRPSTYATIISVIQDRGYAEKIGSGGKSPLKVTDLGIVVTDALVGYMPSVMDIGFTRDMESKLDDIEEGKINHTSLLSSFYSEFSKELEKAKKEMPSSKGGTPTGNSCPKCGKNTIKRLGKYGWFLSCEDKDCSYKSGIDGSPSFTKQLDATSLKCDKCGKPMMKTTGRFGEYLCCEDYINKKCNFTMKLNKNGVPSRKFAAPETDVKCECGKKMVIRVSKKGNPFLSCSGFPKCRKAKDIPSSLSEKAEKAAEDWGKMKDKDKIDAANFRTKNDPPSKDD